MENLIWIRLYRKCYIFHLSMFQRYNCLKSKASHDDLYHFDHMRFFLNFQHQLHWSLVVHEFRYMLQRGKARRLFIVAEALHRPNMLFHHGSHGCFVRHGHRLFEQQLNKIGAAGLRAFLSFRFCWNT